MPFPVEGQLMALKVYLSSLNMSPDFVTRSKEFIDWADNNHFWIEDIGMTELFTIAYNYYRVCESISFEDFKKRITDGLGPAEVVSIWSH